MLRLLALRTLFLLLDREQEEAINYEKEKGDKTRRDKCFPCIMKLGKFHLDVFINPLLVDAWRIGQQWSQNTLSRKRYKKISKLSIDLAGGTRLSIKEPLPWRKGC